MTTQSNLHSDLTDPFDTLATLYSTVDHGYNHFTDSDIQLSPEDEQLWQQWMSVKATIGGKSVPPKKNKPYKDQCSVSRALARCRQRIYSYKLRGDWAAVKREEDLRQALLRTSREQRGLPPTPPAKPTHTVLPIPDVDIQLDL